VKTWKEIRKDITYLHNQINWSTSFLDAKATKIMNELIVDIDILLRSKETYKIYKDWEQGDLIKDRRTKAVFKIVWNKDYLGWWCISRDKATECPLNKIVKYCDKYVEEQI